MKEETHPPNPPPPATTTATKAAESSKCSGVPLSTPPSRLRASSSKVNGSLQIAQKKVVSVSPSTTAARPKSVPKDIISGNSWKIKRSLVSNKPKSGEDVPATLGFQKGSNLEEQVKAVRDRSVNHRPVVEQFSRRILTGPSSVKSRNECDLDGGNTKKKKEEEFQEKLDDKSKILIHNLQAQVLELKAELENAHSLNFELQSQNRILSQDLAAAEAKIAAFIIRDQRELVAEYQSPKFKDTQKLIANKLKHPKIKKEVINETSTTETPLAAALCRVSTADAHRKVPEFPYALPSPPPPPPPPLAPARAAPSVSGKASAVVKLYGSLSKRGGSNDPPVRMMYNKPVVSSAHSSIVREIQSRSSHLLAVKLDIETKGEFINSLIQKVLAAAYTDIEDLLKFVDWLDNELSSLADERAVIKHFKWPEKKADAMREAAIEYRSLVVLESEVSSYKDDPSIPCRVALKKIACLLDKYAAQETIFYWLSQLKTMLILCFLVPLFGTRSVRGMQRLIKLQNSVMLSYQEHKIPTDWMLDLGIVSKIKLASIALAKMYVKRVMAELESIRNSEKESTQETLLLQDVHLAYKAHQFSGVLDSETLCAFEEIRQCVSGHLRGSLEFLAAIPSS